MIIVTEGLLKEKIIALLRRNGATGFTITRSEGEGSRRVRARDFEGPNLKFECIVSKEAGMAIIDEVRARISHARQNDFRGRIGRQSNVQIE